MSNQERIEKAVDNPENFDELVNIVTAALELESILYSKGDWNYPGGSRLFNLRKALEGLFGHDLPVGDDDEDLE